MADRQPQLPARLAGPWTPAGRLWLAVAVAAASTAVLAGTVVLVALATLLRHSCGEDWRWVGLVAATALTGLAVLVGLTGCGLSRRVHAGRRSPWAIAVVALVGLAWAVAVASIWLPTGACS